jgi:hypothetical protein
VVMLYAGLPLLSTAWSMWHVMEAVPGSTVELLVGTANQTCLAASRLCACTAHSCRGKVGQLQGWMCVSCVAKSFSLAASLARMQLCAMNTCPMRSSLRSRCLSWNA